MFIICIICLYPIFLKLGRKVLQKQSSQPVLLIYWKVIWYLHQRLLYVPIALVVFWSKFPPLKKQTVRKQQWLWIDEIPLVSFMLGIQARIYPCLRYIRSSFGLQLQHHSPILFSRNSCTCGVVPTAMKKINIISLHLIEKYCKLHKASSGNFKISQPSVESLLPSWHSSAWFIKESHCCHGSE